MGSSASWAERRVALVIGNSGYTESPLKNPLNDAQDIGRMLESFDFEVTRLEDADRRTMEQAIRRFSRELGRETVGLFYFAGHGLQVDGENYLMPVDAGIESEVDVRYEAVPLGRLLDGMSRTGGGLNLVVLDACRNNPYTRSFRSMERGFTRSSPTTAGTMIMYATEPGELAADGEGRNGIFTGELIRMMEAEPQLKIEQLFKVTSNGVHRKTGGRQSPWSEGVIRGDFSFALAPANPDPEPIVVPPVEIQVPLSIELAVWEEAKKGNTLAYYQVYLNRYPAGTFSGLAKLNMNELEKAQRRSEEVIEARLLEQTKAQAEITEQARRRRINQLVELASQNIKALRLTAPEGNNANSQLDELEALDPENGNVEEGRADIKERYIGWIEKQLGAGNVQKAEEYLISLGQVTGSGSQVEQVRARITEFKFQESNLKREQEIATQQALVNAEEKRRQEEEQARERSAQRRLRGAEVAAAQAAEKALLLSRSWRRGIQVGLSEAGFGVGVADGLWGARTRTGIKRWQTTRGLAETGYLNEESYRKLVTELGVKEVEAVEQLEQVTATVSAVSAVSRESQEISLPELVEIKGGKFKIGGEKDGALTIKLFEISKYEISVNQFRQFVKTSGYQSDALSNVGGVNGCKIWFSKEKVWKWTSGKGVGFSQSDDHPVTCVSWNDAKAYIKWLNTRTTGGYRLPSEAEWEYAASAGASGEWSFRGDESVLCIYGNGADKSTSSELFWSNKKCSDSYIRTSPIGKFRPNANGLYDVHGNVGEWVEDCWHSKYKGVPGDGRAWTIKCDLKKRVVRGGGWFHSPDVLQTRHRYWFVREYRDSSTGFRVARSSNT